MKFQITLLAILLFLSCKEQQKEKIDEVKPQAEVVELADNSYPSELVKVFDAHGGLDQWRSMKKLVFEIPKSDYSEVHTINLHSREDKVEMPEFSMGYDGKDVWLDDPGNKYEGDAVFYHNLMFYFYAMPFVLADDGIVYAETEELEYEGRNYPGISISYESEVGASPEDEYFIHFDPETGQMAWLGYTVTYRTGEKSDNVKWIRYADWQETDGVLLPKSITWHKYEGRDIKEESGTVEFENVVLSKEAANPALFEMPESARVVKPVTHS